MSRRCRPILGAIGGFLFGLALGVLLLTVGALALDSILLVVLPLLFLVLGIVWAFAAPLGRRTPSASSGPD